MPDADEFVYLCEIYNVESFSIFDDKKNAPAPEGAEADRISVEDMKYLLRALGYDDKVDNLSEKDVLFLGSIFELLDAWFDRHP